VNRFNPTVVDLFSKLISQRDPLRSSDDKGSAGKIRRGTEIHLKGWPKTPSFESNPKKRSSVLDDADRALESGPNSGTSVLAIVVSEIV
jgi:hypothetical protein